MNTVQIVSETKLVKREYSTKLRVEYKYELQITNSDGITIAIPITVDKNRCLYEDDIRRIIILGQNTMDIKYLTEVVNLLTS
jgi:flagellar assembly factor FliW